MAKADIKMPDDFLLKLSRLGSNMDGIAETVLEAGGEVVLEKVQGNLAAVIGAGTKYDSRSTGELAGALGLSPVKVDGSGNHDIKRVRSVPLLWLLTLSKPMRSPIMPMAVPALPVPSTKHTVLH